MPWWEFFSRRKRVSETAAPLSTAALETGDLNAEPPGFRLPASLGLDAEVEAQLRERGWRAVVRGDDDADGFVDCLEEEIPAWGISEKTARAAFAAVVKLRRAQLAQWQELPKTPLTQAFEALAERGIVARENFTCCGTCASAEIGGERDDSRQWRGYIYYHQQDTDRLIDDRSTYIGYGAFVDAYMSEAEWTALSDSERDAQYQVIVGKLMHEEVIPVLEQHGAVVTWNGDLGTRIYLDKVEGFIPLP